MKETELQGLICGYISILHKAAHENRLQDPEIVLIIDRLQELSCMCKAVNKLQMPE